jgi:hypothetical protein
MPAKKASKTGEQLRSRAVIKKGVQLNVPKPTTFVVGDELEYRIQRLMTFMGYFSRRARPIYTVGRLDQATDLDVFSIRWKEPFRRELVIAECKSGSSRPLDRVFWLAGVRQFVSANEAFLVRHGTKWNIKDFAKQCGVNVIDSHRIEELEKNYGIEKDDWPGLSDIQFAKATAGEWNSALKTDSNIWELYWTLCSEIQFDEPFAIINYLLSNLRLLTARNPTMPQNSFYKFLIAEALCLVALSAMRLAEYSFDLSPKDRDGFTKKGLSYGDFDPEYADRILRSAHNLASQAVMHYTNNKVEIDPSLFEMPVPPGAGEISMLVNSLVSNYPNSLRVVQVCDILLSEMFVKQGRPRGLLRRIYPCVDLKPVFDLVQNYLRLMVNANACPSYVLESISLTNATERDSAKRPGASTPTSLEIDKNTAVRTGKEPDGKNKE